MVDAPVPPSLVASQISRTDFSELVSKAGFHGPVRECLRLKGDASNRTYSRLHLAPEHRPPTLILMELAEPEAFKQSEEAVSGRPTPIVDLPFLNVQQYLRARGLGVPEIYYYDREGGRLVLEDLGDCTLWDAVAIAPAERVETLYQQAVDELVMLQRPDPAGHFKTCIAFDRRFDDALLLWELDHFLEYGIEARRGEPVPAAHRAAIRRAFGLVAEELAGAETTLVHRDYHSRNLMLHDGRLRVIDFQDALLGPRSYDLASLLRDSYVTLEEALIDRLIAYYLAASSLPVVDARAFRRLFDLTSLQRNLKAAGRFIYIEKVKGRSTHLPYVAPTLRSVRRNLSKYDDLADLRDLLTPFVPELA